MGRRSGSRSNTTIAAAMKVVTSALAEGEITPGEAVRIAAMVDTFVRAIDTSQFERRLQELGGTLGTGDVAAARGTASTRPHNQ